MEFKKENNNKTPNVNLQGSCYSHYPQVHKDTKLDFYLMYERCV